MLSSVIIVYCDCVLLGRNKKAAYYTDIRFSFQTRRQLQSTAAQPTLWTSRQRQRSYKYFYYVFGQRTLYVIQHAPNCLNFTANNHWSPNIPRLNPFGLTRLNVYEMTLEAYHKLQPHCLMPQISMDVRSYTVEQCCVRDIAAHLQGFLDCSGS